ncbi:hypothetical protein [Stenotrophomonas maltophilia]|uniref:hypothetical protein n=1 Tax=Stenotrophomonas maltophilia TaxID=40324 RepID=UPI0021C98A7D|nr:hypothetical protein [Stenotrophomonas maltophilia]MCU1021449.1 hypothetical protein [Stenotrophomonas maltophilia]
MNTTMADGAEQRLDAQIAEALFGQPGMSKMDVANRVRELRGDGPALLVGGPTGGTAQAVDLGQFTDADVRAWVERNDLGGSFGSLTDARCAFDDARSAHLIDGKAVGDG